MASSSQCCPVTRQMSCKSSCARKVKGAKKPMWSPTLATRLWTTRCVSDLVVASMVSLLTANVSVVWSHFTTSTCNESSLHDAITVRSVDSAEQSIRSARILHCLQILHRLHYLASFNPKSLRCNLIYWWLFHRIHPKQDNCPFGRFQGRLSRLQSNASDCTKLA